MAAASFPYSITVRIWTQPFGVGPQLESSAALNPEAEFRPPVPVLATCAGGGRGKAHHALGLVRHTAWMWPWLRVALMPRGGVTLTEVCVAATRVFSCQNFPVELFFLVKSKRSPRLSLLVVLRAGHGKEGAGTVSRCWAEACAIEAVPSPARAAAPSLSLPASPHPAPSVPRESAESTHTRLFSARPSPACVLSTVVAAKLALRGETHRLAVLVSFRSGCVFLGSFGSACTRLLALDLRVSVALCHISDYSKGFGGKYGVQKDRMDKVSGPGPGCGVLGRRGRELAEPLPRAAPWTVAGGGWALFSEAPTLGTLLPGCWAPHSRAAGQGAAWAGPELSRSTMKRQGVRLRRPRNPDLQTLGQPEDVWPREFPSVANLI